MGEYLGQILGPLAQMLGFAQGAAGGGLPTLLAQLENAGLAEQVSSWIGRGENLPVTAEELSDAFTPEQLNNWAEQAGTTPDAILELMSKELPATVDRATLADKSRDEVGPRDRVE